MKQKVEALLEANPEGIIEGKNAVLEALRAKTPIDKIFVAKGESDNTINRITSAAKAQNIVITQADRRRLDSLSQTKTHQGIVAVLSVQEYASVDDMLALAQSRNEPPLIIVCDELSDPHNLGAIIRTAECVGAHGVIIPKRRSVGLTAVVAKTSAGAVSHIPVAKVPNLPMILKELKKEGLWVFGADAEGSTALYESDLKGPTVIVVGSEGDGMGRLVKENCDFLLNIPMRGKLNSLNASVATSIILYEALRQRL